VKKGIVYLVGAGPGDPGLITVRGVECLKRAEVVIYDYLANPALLAHAPKSAERLYVGKLGGRHHTPQEKINTILLEKAGEGKVVVRLKGGDPYVFGRGGEEAQALHEAQIPFEVIPGVTAAFAAAAYAGVPLTHRDYTTSLGLVTGHESPEKKLSTLDWEKLATGIGTLVCYMGMTNLPLIAAKLIEHGRSPQTPVAIVQWATTPRQKTLVADLETVVQRVADEGIKPPAIIVVGEVVALRKELRWFDARPLFGRRILVTRTAEQAGEFTSLLEADGAQVIESPTIHLVPPESWAPLDGAIEDLPGFDWLILTSVNAVHTFFDRLAEKGLDARALAGCRICAVGPKTAEAIRSRGIYPDLIPNDYKAEGVVAAFAAKEMSGRRVLFPRADRARDLIPRELTRMGAEVIDPVVYRNIIPETLPEGLSEALEEGVDCATFTSSSTVENLHALLGEERFRRLLKNVAIASIGPITSATCRKLGLTVTIEPKEYTLSALTNAITCHFKGLNH